MSEWAAAALVVGLLVVVGGPLLWWVLTSGHDAAATRAATARFRERPKRPDFDPEVLYYDHETGKKLPIGVTLSVFLSARREYSEEA